MRTHERFKCALCGWIGEEAQMESDWCTVSEDGDEAYCDTICPQCHAWQNIEDYMEKSAYYLQFLEDIDAKAASVTSSEMRFIEDMLKNRPYHLSYKQVDWIKAMARKYLGEEID